MTSEAIHKGSCFCKTISWSVRGAPLRSVYCHCTLCQRLHASPFIHTIHYPASAFSWTHASPHEAYIEKFPVPEKPWKSRVRCKQCGVMFTTENSMSNAFSVFGPVLERDDKGRIQDWEEMKPTAHIFYGTRLLDVRDGLKKWEGYDGESNEIVE